MKNRVLPILLSAAMVCGLTVGAFSGQAEPAEVVRDDFSATTISDSYAALGSTAKVADGKLVIDTTGIAADPFGGVAITKQKVSDFVLEFDLHNECSGTTTFGITTGLQDAAAPTHEAHMQSALVFGTVDSMSVHNAAGPWQRYSWNKVPADARVRVTVKTDAFSIEYKEGEAEWKAIPDHAAGTIKLTPTEGYIALVVDGGGKVSVDNIKLTGGDAVVLEDDFAAAPDYAVTPNTVQIADGKLVIDTTSVEGDAFAGATLLKQKVSDFVLEFDLHNECAGANSFCVVTGIGDTMAPNNAAYVASSLVFGSVDSMSVHNAAGQWQRYSWNKVPADARVRLTVNADTFLIEHKVGEGDWTAIPDHGAGAVKLAPAEGYLAFAVTGNGKVTVDNVSLITEPAAGVDPIPEPEPEPEPEEIAGENYVWTDDFERTELGDNYVKTAAGLELHDGRMYFTNETADAQGVFFKTAKLGNKYAISFDINMQEGSACPAFLVGMDAKATPVMYWDASVDRLSLYMEKFMVGRAGAQLDLVPNRGTDADVVATPTAPLQSHCAAYTKAEDEYLNMMFVFDEVEGENVLRVYYKLNTDPAEDMNILRSEWKGVDPAGYLGLVAQGHLSANFWIDNLKVTTALPTIVEPTPGEGETDNPANPDDTDTPAKPDDTQTPENPEDTQGQGDADADDGHVPATGVASAAASLLLAAAGGSAALYFKKKR